MHFIVNIQREKESRILTSRSRSEDISRGRHALTSKPRLTPRLGLCQSMSPSTDMDLELKVILDSHNTYQNLQSHYKSWPSSPPFLPFLHLAPEV